MSAQPIGVYTLHKSSVGDESFVLLTFDWSTRHEVALGATISGTPLASITLNNVESADITLSGQAVDSTKKLFEVLLTDAAAVVGNQYHLVCVATLSTGTVLVEYILITVAQA